MSARACALAALLGAAVAGCHAGAPEPAPPPETYVPTFSPVDSDGQVLRDQEGRQLVLRGLNTKYPGIFDVTFTDGMPPRETVPPFDAQDLTLIRKSGFTVLRLPVNWSAFEPQKGAYQASYLAKIDAFLALVKPFGMKVLLDFHEDGWSKWICEDGAPQWATVPPPTGTSSAGDCHMASSALNAHTSFFDDVDGLQEAFTATYVAFAKHFVGNETVFGYELFNEPISSDMLVDAFSKKVAKAVREADPKHLVVWEPSALRNIFNDALVSTEPFGVPGAVYAVHIYIQRVGDWLDRTDTSVTNAQKEARSWGLPLMVTEHGCDPVPDGLTYADRLLDDFDQIGASSMYWIWNPGAVTRNADGSFAYTDGGQVLEHLARPYAPAVGGDLVSVKWDGAATTLTVVFKGRPDVPGRHDVFWNKETPVITCDGAAVTDATLDAERQTYTASCGGAGEHTLVFRKGG